MLRRSDEEGEAHMALVPVVSTSRPFLRAPGRKMGCAGWCFAWGEGRGKGGEGRERRRGMGREGRMHVFTLLARLLACFFLLLLSLSFILFFIPLLSFCFP